MKEDGEKPFLRLFIGIALSEEVRGHVSEVTARLKDSAEGVRWVPDRNLHVTLKFLGDCRESQVEGILSAMATAAEHLPLQLKVGGVGAFPSQGSARVIWVGSRGQDESIGALFNDLDVALGRLGFNRERRKYRPHITIGRVKRPPLRLPEGFCGGFDEVLALEVNDIVLYQSRLSPAGAEYTMLGRTTA